MLTFSTTIPYVHIDRKGPSRGCKSLQGDDSIGIRSFSHIVGGLVEPHWNRHYVKHRQQWMVIVILAIQVHINSQINTSYKVQNHEVCDCHISYTTPTPHTTTLKENHWEVLKSTSLTKGEPRRALSVKFRLSVCDIISYLSMMVHVIHCINAVCAR